MFQLSQKVIRPDSLWHKNPFLVIKYIKISLIHQSVNVFIYNEKLNFLRFNDICADQYKDEDQAYPWREYKLYSYFINTTSTVQSLSEIHPRHSSALLLKNLLLKISSGLNLLYIPNSLFLKKKTLNHHPD